MVLGGAHKGFGEANLKNSGLRGANLERSKFDQNPSSLLTKK
jgi:hypothetical protein